MRAANQLDLIYKRGQAGVTKASVTIVFDNSDPNTSPDGFQGHKQITVTRQIAMPNISKYLLNGHKAQQTTIHNLFQSVQLNINNPNFVIMQGRITKVLNMRPQEILGMVEEAAGTRMFEERKAKAFKAMSGREKKLHEFTSDLEHEIKPKLEKLRLEKKRYAEYTKALAELEVVTRVLHAHEWASLKETIDSTDEEIAGKTAEIEEFQHAKKTAQKEIKAAEKAAEGVVAQRAAEIAKGGKLKKLQEKVDNLEKDVVKYKTQIELKEGSITQEEEKGEALGSDLKNVSLLLHSIPPLTLFKAGRRRQQKEERGQHDRRGVPGYPRGPHSPRREDQIRRRPPADATHGPQRGSLWRWIHGSARRNEDTSAASLYGGEAGQVQARRRGEGAIRPQSQDAGIHSAGSKERA